MKTIAFFGLIFHGMFTIVFLVLWFNNRDHMKGLGYWTVNLSLHTLARLLIILNVGTMSVYTTLLGNIVTIVGAVLFLFGLAAFTETRLNSEFYLIFTLLLCAFSIILSLLVENQLYRSLLNGMATVFLSARYLTIFWKKRTAHGRQKRIYNVLILIYSVMATTLFLRVLYDLVALLRGGQLTVFDSNNIRMSNLMALILLTGVNFCIFLLINNKLLDDLTIESATKTEIMGRLRFQAEHDQLTDTLNRNGLENRLDNLLSSDVEKSRFMVLLLDIDNFKEVNDTHGHNMGDQVLIRLASLLRNAVRSGDYVGRWGGDEFLVIATDVAETDDAILVDRILTMTRNFDWGRILDLEQLSVTVSIGHTRYHRHDTKHHILKRCDKHLYIAKNSGKNRSSGDVSDNMVSLA